jgi:outer membrane biosynthesis protein TonB
MIALVSLLLAVPQDAVAAPEPEYEEVVVTATAGRVALVFDKATDGRLINCRVFKSSGVATVDARACTALPDCVTSTKGQQFCGGEGKTALVAVEPRVKPEEPKFGLGAALKPEPPKVPAVGPTVATQTEDDPNRLTKLPPPPKADNGPPVITFGGPKVEEPR